MRAFKIGLVQANLRSAFAESVPEIARVARPLPDLDEQDIRFNQERMLSMVAGAAEAGAELVVGPESHLDGWSARADILRRIAAPIPSPVTDGFAELASRLGIWLCVGLFERAGQKIYNAAVLFSPADGIAGVYRKTHETKEALAAMRYDLGDALPIFETDLGVVGMLICHDRWYPEAVRRLRLQGAELIVNPVAAGVLSPHHAYHDIHRCTLRAHAYQNGVFWACCNAANHGGHSLLIAPDGRVLAEAGPAEQILLAELTPDAPGRYDFVSNLRPELYDPVRP